MPNSNDQIEGVLRNNAIYSSDIEKMKKYPVDEFLKGYELKRIGKGFESRAFKIKNTNWVVKEGRWDLDFKPIMHLTIKIPRQQTQKLLRNFELTFLPEEKVVLNQYEHYLKLVRYFAFFTEQSQYYHPKLKSLKKEQKNIRNKMLGTVSEIAKSYSINNSDKLKDILSSNLKLYNFLPKEYLLYGKSISEKNEGKETYYIFQEFVKGKTLFEHDTKGLSGENKEKMILFSYLVLFFNHAENLVPDLRPRYILQTHDWFGNTDNIILTDTGPKMIDTRRVWETESNFVKRGLLVPELIILRTKHYLRHYLNSY